MGSKQADRVVICLPTYNEQENILPLLKAVLGVVPEATLLVVDDASPDGTGDLVDGMAQEDGRVVVLRRQAKDGLGRAYTEGFRFAIDRLQARIIVQMDADFSHPVAKIPDLIRQLNDYDLVIGSRYVPGGGTARWNLCRRLISRFGSLYSRLWLGLPLYDLTSGFKAWRVELLARVIAEPIAAGGYVFQVETTWKANRLGARIVELPFVFADRVHGQSKMSPAIAFEAFWRLPCLALADRWHGRR
jgi:dolichol-phosphate mannosyltransferase